MKNGLKIYLNEVFKKIQTMPFDPNSAKKAGKNLKELTKTFGDSSYGKYLKSLVNENQ